MNILIAPAQYKGTIPAYLAADIIHQAFEASGWISRKQPVSDGGEGFLDAFVGAGAELRDFAAHDPLGRPIKAPVAFFGDKAIIEMARASGIELISEHERNIRKSSSFGTGELLHHAFGADVRTVIIGMGGSATNDGGMHMMRALGVGFFDADGREITDFMEACHISNIDLSKVTYSINNKRVIGATDVINPLLGDKGATYVFGPQKGADPRCIEELESSMECYADQVSRCIGRNHSLSPGAGAAGGLGFAIKSFFNAELQPGFDLVAEIVGLEEQVRWADVVITGEGKLDHQTEFGKAPSRIRDMARKHGRKIWAVVGIAENECAPDYDGIISMSDLAGTSDEAMRQPEKWLRKAACLAFEQIRTAG